MVEPYIPSKGDLIWLDFDPQSGREQSGRRPALVISPRSYNAKVGLALCCPVTSQVKGYPFEVMVDSEDLKGVILADHVKSLDWHKRKASHIDVLPKKVFQEVLDKLQLLIEA